MINPPQPPRRVSKEEILKRRVEKNTKRRANKHAAQRRVQVEINAQWPYSVTLESPLELAARSDLRQWMLQQQLRVYESELDNRSSADVVWNKNWQIFRFSCEDVAVLFNMCFK